MVQNASPLNIFVYFWILVDLYKKIYSYILRTYSSNICRYKFYIRSDKQPNICIDLIDEQLKKHAIRIIQKKIGFLAGHCTHLQ